MKNPLSSPRVLDYEALARGDTVGPTRRVRIGAGVIAVALSGVVLACFLEARHRFGGIDDFVPLLAIAGVGLIYCLLVTLGLVHKNG